MGKMVFQAAGTAGAKAMSREYVNWTKCSGEEAHVLSMRQKRDDGRGQLSLLLVSKSPHLSSVTSACSSQATPAKLGREEPSGHPRCQQGSGEQGGNCQAWECSVSTLAHCTPGHGPQSPVWLLPPPSSPLSSCFNLLHSSHLGFVKNT